MFSDEENIPLVTHHGDDYDNDHDGDFDGYNTPNNIVDDTKFKTSKSTDKQLSTLQLW